MWGDMVSDSWFSSLLSMWKSGAETEKPEKPLIGILAFEVSGLMLKVVNLWHFLSDKEIFRLREQIVDLVGAKRLVSEDDDYLMELALDEIIEDLGQLSRSVIRLGKRCANPVYHRLEQFFNDPIQNGFQWFGWEYRLKKMERKVKKMESFVAATTQLSQEQEVLVELEQTLRRMQVTAQLDRVKLLEFQQRVMCQRQEVRNLKDLCPWNRTYDYIVRILARSLFTILARIKHVFGTNQLVSTEENGDWEYKSSDCLPRSHSFSAHMHSSVYPSESNLCGFYSGPLKKSGIKTDKIRMKNMQQHKSSVQQGKLQHSKTKRMSHVGPFKGCMVGGIDSPIEKMCKPTVGGSMRLRDVSIKTMNTMENANMGLLSSSNKIYYKLLLFNSKNKLLKVRPSTLGDAALALHYAKMIILIEKLALSPHLISPDARDDLYNMLPTTIRAALRARLRSYPKNTASSVYDPALATEWNLAVVRILEWLGPLAHNTTKWHSERNIEKQQEVSSTNVLLVQTLYFANQAKTEAAITELLMGLNYKCRIDDIKDRVMLQINGRETYDYVLRKEPNQIFS
ncbi:hypothetical protein FEM48_Zijuj12G0053900 [Ziziphus jujuba var. spinosa]|uniref:Protein PSK SIMULATOR 1-like n=1 Tax=Ziziphus jujuba var. spinosa TaxID=714518 RepID=A0A978UBF0_ZIZJJ|nr:hypothetical protein FEM48_Zijuj12G0053900 [Ziziphus jujuba var. spinosa]